MLVLDDFAYVAFLPRFSCLRARPKRENYILPDVELSAEARVIALIRAKYCIPLNMYCDMFYL